MLDGKSESTSLMEFPCDYTLKVFGKSTKQFENAVIQVMKKNFHGFAPTHYTRRFSADKNYLALTIVFRAESKEQLETLYAALQQAEGVLIVL